MIEKALDQITKADIDALVAAKTSESRTLDYKRDLPLAKDEDRRELARDVSSLANAAGGDIIYGIDEARDAEGKPLGVPQAAIGVECTNFDALKLRYDSIIRDLLDPRVQGVSFQFIDGFERGPVVIVRIPKSWLGPHMVSFQSQTHFYSRNNAGRHPLDVREIRASFLGGTEIAAKIQKFREERLGHIIADELPVPLRASDTGARVVVHVVPVGDRDASGLDLSKLKEQSLLRPMGAAGGWGYRFNLDGLVAHNGASYAQAFRHGALEGVAAGYGGVGNKGEREIYAIQLAVAVVKAVNGFFEVLRSGNFEGPASVMLTVIGVKGARVYAGPDTWVPEQDKVTIDRDILILPDVFVEGLDADPRAFLRPTFDALWQASGFARSLAYDKNGIWKTENC